MSSPSANEVKMVPVTLVDVLLDLRTGWAVLILKELAGRRAVSIWIQAYEAYEAVFALRQIRSSRPRSFEFLANSLASLNAEVDHAVIYGIETVAMPGAGNVEAYVARLILRCPDGLRTLEGRSSDVVPVTAHQKRPFFAAEEVLVKADLTFPLELEEQLGVGIKHIHRLAHPSPPSERSDAEEEEATRMELAQERAVRRLIAYLLRDYTPPPATTAESIRRWWASRRRKDGAVNKRANSGFPIPHEGARPNEAPSSE